MNNLIGNYATLILKRPIVTLLVLFAVTGFASMFATNIRFDTQFSALLPPDAVEIQEINRLRLKAGGTEELIVAVHGGNETQKLRYARRVVEMLRAQPWIVRADVEFPIDFFRERKLWFLSTTDLEKVRDTIDEEIDKAKARANPFYVNLDDDAETQEKPWAALEGNKELNDKESLLKERFTSPDGKYLFVRVKPAGLSTNFSAAKEQLFAIQRITREARPEEDGVAVRFAGTLINNYEQNERMNADMYNASILALILILIVMTVYLRKLWAVVIIAIPLISGVIITMAVTHFAFEQLNLVTAFLISALFGLGVDFEVHLYLRYLEYLNEIQDRKRAMWMAFVKTLPGNTSAAFTMICAFAAMSISSFRGFREYGLIAAYGIFIAYIVAYVGTPPLAYLLERKPRRPLKLPGWLSSLSAKHSFPFGAAVTMVIVGLIFFAYSATQWKHVRWHTNFREIRGISESANFTDEVSKHLGGSLSPAGIWVQSTEQARTVENYLNQRRKTADSMILRTLSLASLIPRDVEQKQAILTDIATSVRSVLDEKLKKEDREKLDELLTMSTSSPWHVNDIPNAFRRFFETLDGKEQFVLMWPNRPIDHDQDVMDWAAEINEIHKELRDKGVPVEILEMNRMGARMLFEMKRDAPLIFATASITVFLILLVDFKRLRHALLIAGSLGIGVVWMFGAMHLFGVDINVFNQAVLPTVLGLGVDNAIHIQHRYLQEGRGHLGKVIATAGTASFLTTATEMIGFGTSVGAHHLGVRSLGWLALIGLITTFVSTTIFFVCILRIGEGTDSR